MEYDDIINLPHHVSQNHKAMSMEQRAAQFAPFAALNGHEEALEETGRLTDAAPNLSQCEIEHISTQLIMAMKDKTHVKIEYFVPDSFKYGGRYSSVAGIIKEWRATEHTLVMNNGVRINLFDVVAVTFPG